MDRLFSVFVLLVLLALAPAGMRAGCIEERAQPVFFSMLFPQLVPPSMAGELLLIPLEEGVAL